MRRLSRREFLRLAGGSAMAAPFLGLPSLAGARPDSRAWLLTTLARTIERGEVLAEGTQAPYYRLRYGEGERPHMVREDLAKGARPAFRRSILNFVHHTDMQLTDVQSPIRVEYLDRFSDQECKSIPFGAAFSPQESLHLQAFERMLRTIRAIGSSPVTGEPFRFAICTGDNIDNSQWNELRMFIGVMDGGVIEANSGGQAFEGVQAVGWGTPSLQADPEYWHPDPVPDKYKEQYGFPAYPGLLEKAIAPFRAAGAGMPWYSCYGNHDGLIQGNFPPNVAMDAHAVGSAKATGPPPGFNPCDEFETLSNHPQALVAGPARIVTPDGERRVIGRREYVAAHLDSPTRPRGHGFTDENLDQGTAYYVEDRFPEVRMIVLDTTNPGGESSGSIGARQLAWLEQRLVEVHSRYYDTSGQWVETGNRDRLAVLFSHHGIATMNNVFITPDPFNPQENDLPRFHGPVVEALVHRFPNVILWVNGHTHRNRIVPRPAPSDMPNQMGAASGFWDVASAAIADWPTQSRLIEIVDNGNGLLSIFGTVVNHSAPPDPTRPSSTLSFLASVHREVAANDPQEGVESGKSGEPHDRNVELLVNVPFPLSGGARTRSARRVAARA